MRCPFRPPRPFPRPQLEPGARHGESSAKINQDRGAVCHPFAGLEHAALFCVFDGHGTHGERVSQFVATALRSALEDHPTLLESPRQALSHAFLQADALLRQEASIDAHLSGTTALVALLLGQRLLVANAGDSRAVLARRAPSGAVACVALSSDHKPDTPAEMARIHKAKGYVSPPEEEWGGCAAGERARFRLPSPQPLTRAPPRPPPLRAARRACGWTRACGCPGWRWRARSATTSSRRSA